MKNDWLTASSFERTHEIVSAINTLSIHAKLVLAGIDDSTNQEEVEKLKQKYYEQCLFIEYTSKIVN